MNDSSSTERRIWRRDAPSVRSVANSRVRWVTVIESELAITNEPTKSAMIPNESRNVCRKLVKAFVSLASVVGLRRRRSAPASAAGATDRIAESSSASLTPDFFETRIWSSLPSLLNSRWARLQVEAGERRAADVEPARSELDQAGRR